MNACTTIILLYYNFHVEQCLLFIIVTHRHMFVAVVSSVSQIIDEQNFLFYIVEIFCRLILWKLWLTINNRVIFGFDCLGENLLLGLLHSSHPFYLIITRLKGIRPCRPQYNCYLMSSQLFTLKKWRRRKKILK